MSNVFSRIASKLGLGQSAKKQPKGLQKKVGAGPALAAHSKDAGAKGASGQNAKAAAKKAD